MSGSFLGKKPNKPATEIVQDIARFHELLMSESFSASGKQINANNILVRPTAKRDFVDTQNNTHLVVALFTTMWARLKLYRDVLDKLQERVRYTDTDLIIFRCDPEGWNPRTGAGFFGRVDLRIEAHTTH